MVPNENEQVCAERARVQVSRWMAARCVRARRAWAAEKFLYRDYVDWCRQQESRPCPRELFVEILDQLFRREMDGWEGIALAMDVATVDHIM